MLSSIKTQRKNLKMRMSVNPLSDEENFINKMAVKVENLQSLNLKIIQKNGKKLIERKTFQDWIQI